MRIVQASCYYPPHVGGVENHVKELANALSEAGNELKILTADIPPIRDDLSLSTGTGTSMITITRFRAIELFPGYVPFIFGLSRIRDIEADVFHSHCPPPFFSQAFKKEKKHPHVITYHFDLEVPERVGSLKIPAVMAKFVERVYNRHYALQLLDACDAIIVTGRSYAETSPVLSKFSSKCEVIPNGIDIRKFDAAIEDVKASIKRNKNILFVGRLVYPKGIEYLIRAMPGVLKEVPEAKLVIVGRGEDRASLEKLVRSYELTQKVEFRGFLSFKELVKSYLEASVFVLPSFTRLENFGIVLLEAMACRTPVIASDIPGVRENITGGNGLLFTPGDVDGLSDCIVRIISDDRRVMRMGEAGRKLVETKFDWRLIAQQVMRVYESLV